MIDYSVKEERFALARTIAEEGIVMLRNEGMLPLRGAKNCRVRQNAGGYHQMRYRLRFLCQ